MGVREPGEGKNGDTGGSNTSGTNFKFNLKILPTGGAVGEAVPKIVGLGPKAGTRSFPQGGKKGGGKKAKNFFGGGERFCLGARVLE